MKTFTTFLSIFLISCFISNAGSGQTIHVLGKVVDKNTLEPLEGVNISLESNSLEIGTITNDQGEFRLWNLPHDTSKILISYNGYEVASIDASTLNSSFDEITIIKLDEKVKTHKSTSERKLAFLKKKLISTK